MQCCLVQILRVLMVRVAEPWFNKWRQLHQGMWAVHVQCYLVQILRVLMVQVAE